MKTLGLLGIKGSGKDTVGQYFSEQYGYTSISFADSLKDCLSAIFGWDRMMLEGRNPKSRAWREQVDHWWADKLGIPDFTPRFAMTHFGTDIMRKHFNDEIWILNTQRKIERTEGPVLLNDIRFPNEFDLLKQLNGVALRIERPDMLTRFSWVGEAKMILKKHHDDPPQEIIQAFNSKYNVHESEWYLLNRNVDHILDNHSDIPYLYNQCEEIAKEHGLVEYFS